MLLGCFQGVAASGRTPPNLNLFPCVASVGVFAVGSRTLAVKDSLRRTAGSRKSLLSIQRGVDSRVQGLGTLGMQTHRAWLV